jgi:hypothetical protein
VDRGEIIEALSPINDLQLLRLGVMFKSTTKAQRNQAKN